VSLDDNDDSVLCLHMYQCVSLYNRASFRFFYKHNKIHSMLANVVMSVA